MNRTLVYLLLAGIAAVLQTVVLPVVIPGGYKPNLLLVLVIYLGLFEEPWRGGILVYLLGWLYDGIAGVFPGLHGFALLGLFFAVRAVVTRVNTESSSLLLVLVAVGTLLEGGLTTFALEFFAGPGNYWPLILWRLPLQMVYNLVAAFVLLKLILWLQRTFHPSRELPGLRKLDSRYES